MKYPKFEEKIRHNIVDNAYRQSAEPGYGIILDFDIEENTAMVLMSRPGSDQPGEIFKNVPCPVQMGVQTVSPEQGRPCWVAFKDGTQSNPMVVTYFNHMHRDLDFEKQYYVNNDTPRFMTEL